MTGCPAVEDLGEALLPGARMEAFHWDGEKLSLDQAKLEKILQEEAAEKEKDDILNQIAVLKQNLSDTDYVVVKIAEGAATVEEYTEVIAQRKAWRAEIKDMEELILS